MWRRMMGGFGIGLAGALCVMALGIAVTAASSATPVADAAMNGDTAGVKTLLKQGADVNSAQHDGMTALHWAALNDDASMATMLLYAGADANAATRLGGYTPLDIAAKDGHADLVAVLLKSGADPKRADLHGTTPLMLAAASGNVQAVTDLINAGADVNAKENVKGETALMLASVNDRTDAVNVLLAHGADWKPATKVLDWTKLAKDDPRQPRRRTPRNPATPQPANNGAKPSAAPAKPGAKPAVSAEKTQTADAAGPKAEADPTGGKTAGAPAADAHAATSDDAVAAKDAKLNAKSMNAKKAAAMGMSPIRGEMLLVHKKGGLTALLFAARQGYTDAAEALLKGGADLNEVDPGDHTSPLLIAIVNGHYDLAKELLDRGADPNLAQSNNGVTPLYAVLNCQWAPKAEYPQPTAYEQQKTSYLDLMKDLLAHGAKPNARLTNKVWYSGYNFDLSGVNETGATPFWRAAYADDVAAMKILVAHGADPAIATKKPDNDRRRSFYKLKAKKDYSGLAPVPTGGPDVAPLLAASGESYGSSLTANSHRFAALGMLPAVKYLVEDLHADVNARDADGNTALHNAAARGDNAMVLYLVSRGAKIKVVNRAGQTVADMANGPHQRVNPFPATIALAERLGAQLAHKCVSCG